MDAIKLSVQIGQDRRIIIDLPPDTPLGEAELIIRIREPGKAQINTPAREAARTKLAAAGALSKVEYAPGATQPPSSEERQRVWQLFSLGRTSDEIISEDRGAY